MRVLAPLGLIAALGACASPVVAPADAARACTAAPAALALGVSDDGSPRAYRALGDGDDVSLLVGSQGLQHLAVALRGRGFDPRLPRVEVRALRPSDGALAGRLRVRLPMTAVPEDPSTFALRAQILVIESEIYCSLLGGPLRLEVDFDDLAGRCVSLQRTVRLADLAPSTPEAQRVSWRRCCTERLPRCYPPPDAVVAPDVTVD